MLIGVLVIALIGLGAATALVIAHSGSPHQNQAAAATSTHASTPDSTTTPVPAATATSLPNTTSCGGANNTPLTINQVGVSDFAPHFLLPDTLPLKPAPKSQTLNGAAVAPGNSIRIFIGVNLPSGSQVATVCQVSVKLVAFQALPGGKITNVRTACGGFYDTPGGWTGGGCGGAAPADGAATVSFSSTQAGTTMTATLLGQANQQPIQIKADSYGALTVTVQVTTPGTYTFDVGLWQNTTSPQWSTVPVQQIIAVGQIDQYWDGQACTAPAMQSQLPAPTNPPGEFVCPGAQQ